MKKYSGRMRFFSGLMLLILCAMLTGGAVSVCAEETDSADVTDTAEIRQDGDCTIYGNAYLIDNADLLDDEEESLLIEDMYNACGQWDCDIAIVTVQDYEEASITEFADAFADKKSYGFTQNSSGGVVFAISMADREWWISTTGTAIQTFTDAGQEYISDRVVSYLSDGDYYGGFSEFATLSGQFMEQAATGEPYDVDNMPTTKMTPFRVIVCIIIGFLIALIPILVMMSKLKTVNKVEDASQYTHGGIKLTEERDIYRNHVVTKTPIPKDTDSSGGGSSTHTSSGGGTHGGSGGHF